MFKIFPRHKKKSKAGGRTSFSVGFLDLEKNWGVLLWLVLSFHVILLVRENQKKIFLIVSGMGSVSGLGVGDQRDGGSGGRDGGRGGGLEDRVGGKVKIFSTDLASTSFCFLLSSPKRENDV